MIIPGNPKGEAVRMEDPDSGPLHRSLELPLLIKAMREDKSQVLEHIQQKAAVALSIALGRNPANLLTYEKPISSILPLKQMNHATSLKCLGLRSVKSILEMILCKNTLIQSLRAMQWN